MVSGNYELSGYLISEIHLKVLKTMQNILKWGYHTGVEKFCFKVPREC